MTSKEQLHKDLIHYGFIVKDKSFSTSAGNHRITIFRFMDALYYNYMLNGELIECEEMK